jgi:hypothetical protein
VRFRCESNTAWPTRLAADFIIASWRHNCRYFPSYFVSPTSAEGALPHSSSSRELSPTRVVHYHGVNQLDRLVALDGPTDVQFIAVLIAVWCTRDILLTRCYLLAHTPNAGSQDTQFLRWCEI